MADILKALETRASNFVLDPSNHDLLALIKGFRSGVVYGTKIRFPHALVMIFLFRSGSFRQKCYLVFKATRTHARNLALYCVVYKLSMLALAKGNGGKIAGVHPFIGGLLGGYAVFGRSRSQVSQQIIIYVFVRVVLALAKLSIQPKAATSVSSYGEMSSGGWELLGNGDLRDNVEKYAWPVFASVSWASVMWLWRWHPETVQSSMRSSMNYM
jgi:hypothetical protein